MGRRQTAHSSSERRADQCRNAKTGAGGTLAQVPNKSGQHLVFSRRLKVNKEQEAHVSKETTKQEK